MLYILIGSIGSGKTTIGKKLAEKLSYNFIELDEIALSKTGYLSVTEALEQSATKLSESELATSKELSVQDNLVLAFGGSTIFNQLNFDYFKENNRPVKIVFLDIDVPSQLERILSKHPHLKDDELKIAENLEQMNTKRTFLCKLLADQTIHTSNKTPDQIIDEIVS